MIGRQLAHYRIVGALGAGGMGEVYRAVDTRLGREVALKILPEGVAGDRDRLQRFHQEARALAALNHPNIVTVYSVEEADGVQFLTMERVAGETLAERLRAGGLSVRELLDVAIPTADALAAAHAVGIVHRDLKPGNVMRTEDGRVKVLDFGLAAWRPGGSVDAGSALPTIGVTDGTAPAGTAPYMSPEQLEGRPVDERSDIFALGVTLYELAAGRRPFSGESAAAVSSAILRDIPPPLSTVRTDLPLRLERVVQRCLAKDPRDRYQSVIDLRHDLEDLAEEVGTAGATAEASRAPSRPGVVRRPGVWTVVLTVVAVVAIVAVGILLRGGGEPPANIAAAAPIRSLAVLPFDNLMNDPEQDYFVDGMHEALISTLAKVRELRVISRTSALRYRGSGKALPEIARELGVDGVIEGSVLRSGGRVRITAQLIRGRSDEHLWAESYDRDVGDVLALLSEVATAIAHEVRLALTPEQQRMLTAPRGRGEAQDLFLKGQASFNNLSVADRKMARRHFRQALEIDPGFAPAHAALASCDLVDGVFGAIPPAQAVARIRQHANRALELDPNNAMAFGSLGTSALYLEWDWDRAESYLTTAVELDPGNAMLRHGYADLFLVNGDPEASLEQVRLGREYDPFGAVANGVVLGHLFFAGHFTEVLEEMARIREIFPVAVPFGGMFEFRALWHLGRREEAVTVLRALWSGDPETVAALDVGAATGGPTGALAALADLLARRPGSGALEVASAYAAAGDAERALTWLERAFERREPFVLHIRGNPEFDIVKDDPRFIELVRRVGFPE